MIALTYCLLGILPCFISRYRTDQPSPATANARGDERGGFSNGSSSILESVVQVYLRDTLLSDGFDGLH